MNFLIYACKQQLGYVRELLCNYYATSAHGIQLQYYTQLQP